MESNKCFKCGHSWVKRVEAPLKCPKCQRLKWNVERVTPEGDINGNGNDIHRFVNRQDFYDIEQIAKARNILLDELQLWPRIHQAIYSRFK